MSRWAEMFAALSHARDTVDPLRHNREAASTLSHTVESVTAPEPMRASPSLQRRAGERWSKSAAGCLVNIAHESEVPRVWAEGLAQLDRDRPPGDVPLLRWRRFIDDAMLFLDSHFCTIAATFGWAAQDLFGCDPDRPFARIDQAGLLWLLDGARLLAFTHITAVIETRAGGHQVWRRKPGDPAQVLAWELTQ